MYYLCSENKGADQLRGYLFSHDAAHMNEKNIQAAYEFFMSVNCKDIKILDSVPRVTSWHQKAELINRKLVLRDQN